MSGHLLVRTEFADLYIDVLNLVQCLMMISQILKKGHMVSQSTVVLCLPLKYPPWE